MYGWIHRADECRVSTCHVRMACSYPLQLVVCQEFVHGKTFPNLNKDVYVCLFIYSFIYIYIYIWVNYNISLTWIVRPWLEMISLTFTMIPGFGRSEVVMKFTQIYMYLYIYIYTCIYKHIKPSEALDLFTLGTSCKEGIHLLKAWRNHVAG